MCVCVWFFGPHITGHLPTCVRVYSMLHSDLSASSPSSFSDLMAAGEVVSSTQKKKKLAAVGPRHVVEEPIPMQQASKQRGAPPTPDE